MLEALGMGLGLAGGGVKAYSIVAAAKENARDLKFNAEMMWRESMDVMARAEQDVGDLRRYAYELGGQQRASFAAQGVDVSSDVAVMVDRDTQEKSNEDVRRVWHNASQQAWALRTNAEYAVQKARRVRKQATVDAVGSLLGSAAGAFG